MASLHKPEVVHYMSCLQALCRHRKKRRERERLKEVERLNHEELQQAAGEKEALAQQHAVLVAQLQPLEKLRNEKAAALAVSIIAVPPLPYLQYAVVTRSVRVLGTQNVFGTQQYAVNTWNACILPCHRDYRSHGQQMGSYLFDHFAPVYVQDICLRCFGCSIHTASQDGTHQVNWQPVSLINKNYTVITKTDI